jgi:hypothetical protein
MHVIKAGLTYFAIVFGAGFVFGVFRELVLTPAYGRMLAVLLETPFMLVAITVGSWLAVHRNAASWSKVALLMTGLIGLLLVLVADFGVGLGLRNMTFQDQMHHLLTPAGLLYLGMLAVFVAMPLVMGIARDHARR